MEAIDQTTLLRALIALGRAQEAVDLANSLCPRYEALDLNGILIELLLLKALAHDALGQEEEALAALARSLVLAAPEGYTRLFLEEGLPVAGLLARLRQSRATPDDAGRVALPATYLDRLLAAFALPDAQGVSHSAGEGGARHPQEKGPSGDPHEAPYHAEPRTTGAITRSTATGRTLPGGPGDTRGAVQAAPLVEPLSEREHEVLGLIAAGLTNQAIATRLVVEISTVKTHVLRLYGKLGVHSRTQAINRAQELGLLP
jgi:LuxR family maltose regulon positive regulatory protein